jgi:hypothetical protein
MITVAIIAMFAIAGWRQVRQAQVRPDSTLVVVVVIMVVALQQRLAGV